MAYIPNDWTACEVYDIFTIALRDGVYGAFKGIDGAPRVSGNTRGECRRAIDAYIQREAAYHAATGSW